MRILFVSLAIVIIDQVSKFLVKGINLPSLGIVTKGMKPGETIDIIDNFFRLTFIENPGMAFGLEIGSKQLRSVFTIIASIFIVYFIYKNRKEILYLRISLALILGGAIGNLIDRIFYGVIYGSDKLLRGNVVDFFQINIPDIKIFGKVFYSWPIFNIADIAVSAGFVMILIGYKKIFNNKEAGEQQPSDLQIINQEEVPVQTESIPAEPERKQELPT
ncbi:MAG: signal peptidase II [Ignavibacteriae bacterium]|nr:signal peptidase II [Ignavibacteriota bacterium]